MEAAIIEKKNDPNDCNNNENNAKKAVFYLG